MEFYSQQLVVPAVSQGYCGTPEGRLRLRSSHSRRLAVFYDAHRQGALRLLSTVAMGKTDVLHRRVRRVDERYGWMNIPQNVRVYHVCISTGGRLQSSPLGMSPQSRYSSIYRLQNIPRRQLERLLENGP